MSASKPAPVRGPKTSPPDGDPEEMQDPVGELPADGEQLAEPMLPSTLSASSAWALPEGPGQISWDALVDHTLLQTHAHLQCGTGLGRNRQAIARIAAQSRIKGYFVQHKTR